MHSYNVVEVSKSSYWHGSHLDKMLTFLTAQSMYANHFRKLRIRGVQFVYSETLGATHQVLKEGIAVYGLANKFSDNLLNKQLPKLES